MHELVSLVTIGADDVTRAQQLAYLIMELCCSSAVANGLSTCLFLQSPRTCPLRQAEAHNDILARFSSDMDRLASCELLPGARTGSARRLLDLLPEQRLRDWAEACQRSHAAFGDKVRCAAH